MSAAGVSLRNALDEGPWTGFQKRAGMLAILAVVLDGFDIQLLGVVIPALMKEWGLPRSAFVPVLGLGLVAMSIGTAVNGWLGDRWGRKTTLIGSMVVFGAGTLLSAFATDMTVFMISRLVASLGLGGAMPAAVALLSEFTPLRRRSFMVTFGMVSTPVGGVLAGLAAAGLLPLYGWSSLFVLGGVLPLLLAFAVALALPESPQFLVGRPERRAELEAIATRLGADLDAEQPLKASPAGEQMEKGGYRALLSPGERLPSLLLWVQFVCVLMAAYTVFNWLPTLGVSLGLSMAESGALLAAFNFGGIAGALAGAMAIDRMGSRSLTIGYGLAATVVIIINLAAIDAGAPVAVLSITLFLGGVFIAGLQPMLFAIAANAYPAHMRGTGVGAALAIGRLGPIASSYIGSVLIGAGASAFFLFLAALMLMVTAALVVMPRHVAGIRRSKGAWQP